MADNATGDEFGAFRDDPKSGYSPEKFYVRSTGKEGSVSARFPVVSFPAEVLAEIGALIASKTFSELRTQQDVFRDAVVHYVNLRKHQMKDPVLVNKIDVWTRLAEAERTKAVNSATRELISLREESLREERDPVQIKKILDECRQDAGTMESSHYQAEMEALIRRFDRG